jgi:hypothetical protein
MSTVFSHIQMNRLLLGSLVVGASLVLCACGDQGKNSVTTTSSDGQQTQTVTVEDTPQGKVTTTLTKVVEPNDGAQGTSSNSKIDIHSQSGAGEIHVEGDGAKVHIKMPGMDIETDENGNVKSSDVNVRVPGVKINSNESSGDANIDAPFVHIQKDGKGGKVRIKAPFVDINADSD